MSDDFTWRDGERTIRFARGSLAEAPQLLGEGYVLLTSKRALAAAPQLAQAARHVEQVGAGLVDELAGDLLEAGLPDGPLVALGGGRIIDVAKALAAARGAGASVAAIPTTLSAAEMTWVHRHARGVDPATPRVRPKLVLNDPALCASQPLDALAASSANALGHAIEGSLTTLASPVPALAARDAARRLAHGWHNEDEPDRDALALGSLLSGYAIDASWYGLHHVMSQTLVRHGGAGHGPANAAMLPWTTGALRRRFPAALEALDASAGRPIEELARRLAERAGATRLRDLGIDQDALDGFARLAAERGELELTPPAASASELAELYAQAW